MLQHQHSHHAPPPQPSMAQQQRQAASVSFDGSGLRAPPLPHKTPVAMMGVPGVPGQHHPPGVVFRHQQHPFAPMGVQHMQGVQQGWRRNSSFH